MYNSYYINKRTIFIIIIENTLCLLHLHLRIYLLVSAVGQ